MTHDQLLRTMDALMDRAEVVGARIARQLHPLMDQQLSVVFYDCRNASAHTHCLQCDDRAKLVHTRAIFHIRAYSIRP